MGEGRDWGQQEKRRGGGTTSEGTDPLSGDSTPVGEGRADRKSPECLDVPSSSRSQHSHMPRNRRVRVGGVLAQGPRQESHPDVRGQEWRMCTRGLSPNCPQETPPLARGFGAGSPSQSGGREIVLSRCSPKGEIMGALRGGLCRPRPRPQVSPEVQGRSREVIKKINK